MSDTSLLALLALAALAAAGANGAAVGRTANPAVWPMPGLLTAPVVADIIGGQDAKLGEFPYQVSMQVSMLWILEQHICGGTVISEDWVLTAAHCVKGVPWYTSAFVLAGKSNLQRAEDGQQRSAVRRMLVHEKYRGGVGPYDIGLLLLKKRLVFGDNIQPAKLPVQDAIPSGQATLTGWGSTSTSQELVIPAQLQKLDLAIIPFDECNAFIQRQSDESGEKNPLADTNVCVGDLSTAGQGACNGDSGGPLAQVGADGSVVVIGATSWGYFPCQQSPAPSVYTRVSAYVDWIKKKTNIQ